MHRATVSIQATHIPIFLTYRASLLSLIFPVHSLGLWRELILKQKAVTTDILDVSSLAKVSDGYTPGHIVEVINQVLSERRKQQVGEDIWTAFFIENSVSSKLFFLEVQ